MAGVAPELFHASDPSPTPCQFSGHLAIPLVDPRGRFMAEVSLTFFHLVELTAKTPSREAERSIPNHGICTRLIEDAERKRQQQRSLPEVRKKGDSELTIVNSSSSAISAKSGPKLTSTSDVD